MKYFLLSGIFLICSINLGLAQNVGINATGAAPNSSAGLDIDFSDKGILVPRVALTTRSAFAPVTGTATTSLLIYNTATANTGVAAPPNDITPGYYYWDATSAKWVRVSTAATPSPTAWNLQGNTVNSTDFLGTTGGWQSVKIKANGNQLGIIYPNKSVFFGISPAGSDVSNVSFGPRNNLVQTSSYAIGADIVSNGNISVAIGSGTLPRAWASVAIGRKAKVGVSAISGSSSVAIGDSAFPNQNQAIALGRVAKSLGDDNITFGYFSTSAQSQSSAFGAFSNTNAVNATTLGHSANVTGLNSTAIGYSATTAQSNALVLGQSTDANAKVGIGTNSPDSKLHIVATTPQTGFQYQDGSQVTDGIFTSDANGKATWAANPNNMAFGERNKTSSVVLASGSITFSTAAAASTLYNDITITAANATQLNVARAGEYKVTYHVNLVKDFTVGTTEGYFFLSKWGTGSEFGTNTRSYFTLAPSQYETIAVTTYITLAAWETVQLDCYLSPTSTGTTTVTSGTFFSIEFVR